MTVNKIIERASNNVNVRNILIRNAHIKTLLYFGSPAEIPSQLVNKEVNSYLYNPSRQLLILKVST